QKEVMFVAGKASNGLNSDFELIQLLKPVKSSAAQSVTASAVNYHIHVTPNPAHDLIQINYTLPQAANTEIKITGFDGKIILIRNQCSNAGLQNIMMQLPPSITGGVYFITVSTQQGNNVYKLLVQ